MNEITLMIVVSISTFLGSFIGQFVYHHFFKKRDKIKLRTISYKEYISRGLNDERYKTNSKH